MKAEEKAVFVQAQCTRALIDAIGKLAYAVKYSDNTSTHTLSEFRSLARKHGIEVDQIKTLMEFEGQPLE